MSTWKLFLEYAKAHPQQIPKDQKRRSVLYHQFVDSCKCNDTPTICKAIGVSSNNKNRMKLTNDPVFLEAKVKAYEELMADKNKYIAELERFVAKLQKRSKKTHNSV